uniref:Uncharacterized protein n=1 Tax=Pipistrellus kuhlii TaxID=59472 RepID=A0A7J8A809_PIPKU|nr:hypothetical protein mPipKuh1_008853 [Pipistrellus kuhlii]
MHRGWSLSQACTLLQSKTLWGIFNCQVRPNPTGIPCGITPKLAAGYPSYNSGLLAPNHSPACLPASSPLVPLPACLITLTALPACLITPNCLCFSPRCCGFIKKVVRLSSLISILCFYYYKYLKYSVHDSYYGKNYDKE